MEHSPESKNPSEHASPTEWEQVAKMAKHINQRQAEKAPEYATELYKSALDVEKDFDRRRQTIESEGGEMSQKEFEKWEDALSNEISYAERELEKTDGRLETVAECEQVMIFSANDTELHKTIEAQAGRFYHKRMMALREAIQSSNRENSEEDLNYAKDFYGTVIHHLDFKYMTPEEVRSYGYEEYESGRTYAHNAAIKHLNGLNNLAKKYHVRPFTVRNFWPSNLRSKSDQTRAVSRVMRYDRDLVEEYYAIAFSSEIQRRKNIQARQMRFWF